MRENIGKRFRIKYEEYISKLKYEVVALDYNGYIIGFNTNVEDSFLIKGWPQKDGKYGNKYKLFWLIGKNNLIKENNSLNIE
jgi:hypothetical protein